MVGSAGRERAPIFAAVQYISKVLLFAIPPGRLRLPRNWSIDPLARKAHSPTVFPAPGHDHGRCASDAIAHAESVCVARKERLTPMRRQVLEALLASHQPLGAYELIDRLAEGGTRPAPITIYRALDFLREQGFAHRIESRNAFIACGHNHQSDDPVVFLICEKCGAVGEAASAAVADTIKTASRAAGFTPKTPVIEISGICAHCKAA